MQAILVGVTNVVFTLIAIALIDKIGRQSLLVTCVSGIIVCMFSLAYLFNAATYTLTAQPLAAYRQK
jgi:SP family arabinose:H+ symporter-like MFS transporter